MHYISFSFHIYCLMATLNGFCVGGNLIALPVLLYECVNNADRPIVSAVFSLGWAAGEIPVTSICS